MEFINTNNIVRPKPQFKAYYFTIPWNPSPSKESMQLISFTIQTSTTFFIIISPSLRYIPVQLPCHSFAWLYSLEKIKTLFWPKLPKHFLNTFYACIHAAEHCWKNTQPCWLNYTLWSLISYGPFRMPNNYTTIFHQFLNINIFTHNTSGMRICLICATMACHTLIGTVFPLVLLKIMVCLIINNILDFMKYSIIRQSFHSLILLHDHLILFSSLLKPPVLPFCISC